VKAPPAPSRWALHAMAGRQNPILDKSPEGLIDFQVYGKLIPFSMGENSRAFLLQEGAYLIRKWKTFVMIITLNLIFYEKTYSFFNLRHTIILYGTIRLRT
jgi:hypothetical protein